MKLKSYLNELSMKAKTNIEVHKSLGREYNAKITLSDGTTWLYNAVDYEGSGTFDIVFSSSMKTLITSHSMLMENRK